MPFARPALRLPAVLAAGAIAVVLLAGCSTSGDAAAKATAAARASASASAAAAATNGPGGASADPTAVAIPTPTPTPKPIPVTLTQSQVWSAQQVYTFNPNFTADPAYAVKAGSAADQLVQLKGVSYGWVNETSKDQIEVAVAHPNPANFAQFDGQVASSPGAQQVPIDGAPAGTVSYFTLKGGVGTLQIFTKNGYWVVVDSKTFLEPGDAYPIATDVMGNLK
jgi:hypothetical protein